MADGGDGVVLSFPSVEVVNIEEDIYPKPRETASQKLFRRMWEICENNLATAIKKNADYANPDRPFANFEAAPMVGVSVERGMLVRIQDKVQRVSNLLDRPAAVESESIYDTIDDAINYLLLLRVRIEQEHGKSGT